jgi:hypothetical protein
MVAELFLISVARIQARMPCGCRGTATLMDRLPASFLHNQQESLFYPFVLQPMTTVRSGFFAFYEKIFITKTRKLENTKILFAFFRAFGISCLRD